MPRVAFVGRWSNYSWGEDPSEVHLARGLEQAGLLVTRVSDQEGQAGVYAQLRANPTFDAILVANKIGWGGHFFRQVANLSRGRPVLLWSLDFMLGPERLPQFIDCARQVTAVFQSDRADYGRWGLVNVLYLSAAAKFDPTIAHNLVVPRSFAFDAIFVGSVNSPQRRQIVGLMTGRLGGRFRVFGHTTNAPIYGHALAQACMAAKYVIGDNFSNSTPGYWSERNYTIPAHGGMLLTPHVPGIERHFQHRENVLLYTSLDDAWALMEEFARRDDEREKIRAHGWHHVRSRHTYADRAKEMVAMLRERRML